MAQERGLDAFVNFENWLPNAEARERLARADLLYLIARGQPLQLSFEQHAYAAGLPAGSPQASPVRAHVHTAAQAHAYDSGAISAALASLSSHADSLRGFMTDEKVLSPRH